MMLRAYALERLPLRLLLPAAAVLTAATAADRMAWQLAADAALALSLFVQFRIWDDIEDRARDAIEHPSRVLVRAASLRPFHAAAATLGVANIGYLASRSLPAAGLYVALAAALAAWYARRNGRTAGGGYLLLAKYPAFVAILAATRPIERPIVLSTSLAVVYAGACAYEMWHDSSSALRWSQGKGIQS